MNDLTELTHYDDVKKISDLSNDILKNGIDYLYIEKELEVTFGDNFKIELEPIKSHRDHALSVEIVEFFEYVTKQKRFVLIYSLYKELKEFGLKFQRKKTGNIGRYTITMKEENDQLYLEKELFFDEKNILANTVKEYDNKNVCF